MNNSLWKEINEMFINSSRKTEINISKLNNGKKILKALHITSKSAMAAIILNSSEIVVDNWIRIYGQGSHNSKGILDYNLIDENGMPTKIEKMLMIANDVVGGIFALNAGRFSEDIGKVWYFAPDTLVWESLGVQYSEFIAWIAQGDIDDFYDEMRWSTWQEDCKNIKVDEAMLIYPFLWSNEIQLENADKKIVPFEELFNLNVEYSKKFNRN